MLCPNAIGSRSEIVQAGFAHDADAVVPRKFLNSGVCRTQLAPRGESGCLVGVQRHSGDDRGIPMGDDDGGLGTLQIAPDVDDPVDADGGRSGTRIRKVESHPLLADDVEVGVVVDDRLRQRLWCGWGPVPGGGGGHQSAVEPGEFVGNN